MPIDAAELLKALARTGRPIPGELAELADAAPTLQPVKHARPTAAQDGRTARPGPYVAAYAASRFAAVWRALGFVLYVFVRVSYRLGLALWRAMSWTWRAIRSIWKEGTR